MYRKLLILLHVVSVCVDKANAILELDTMDIDGKEIQPENYDIRLSDVTFSYDKRKIIDGVSSLYPRKQRQQSLVRLAEVIYTL